MPPRTITLRRPDGSIHTDETTVDVAPVGVRSKPTELQRVLATAAEQAISRARRVA